MDDTMKTILAGVVRHGLTTLGGALVTGGYMDSSSTAAFVGGGMVLAGVVWSWWQKEGQARALAILARMNPVVAANASHDAAVAAANAAVRAEEAK
jgi:hypothetical protein